MADAWERLSKSSQAAQKKNAEEKHNQAVLTAQQKKENAAKAVAVPVKAAAAPKFTPQTTAALKASKQTQPTAQQKKENAAKAVTVPVKAAATPKFTPQTTAALKASKQSAGSSAAQSSALPSRFNPHGILSSGQIFGNPDNPYSQSPAVRMKTGRDTVPDMRTYTDRRYTDANGKAYRFSTFGKDYDPFISHGMSAEQVLDSYTVNVDYNRPIDISSATKTDLNLKHANTDVKVSDYLTQNETANYFYLVGKYGLDEGKKYIDLLSDDIKDRAVAKLAKSEAKEIAEAAPWASWAFAPDVALQTVTEGYKNTSAESVGKRISAADTTSGLYNMGMEEGIKDGTHNWLSEQIASGLYSTASDLPAMLLQNSAAGIFLAMLYSGGKRAGLKFAQQAANGTLNADGSLASAVTSFGLGAAMFSPLMHLANKPVGAMVDKLGGKILDSAGKQFITGLTKNALNMAGISVADTELDNLADTVFMDGNSNFAKVRKSYIDSGMSERSAASKAVYDVFISPLAKTAISGAFMGAAMGFVGSVSNAVNIADRGRYLEQEGKTYNEIYQTAKALDPEGRTAVGRNAELLFQKWNRNKKLSYSELAAQDLLNSAEIAGNLNSIVKVADLLGVRVVRRDLGDSSNGYYENGVIYLNTHTSENMLETFYHEAMHAIADAAPEKFSQYAASLIARNGYEHIYNDFAQRYEDAGKAYNENIINADIAAEFGINFFNEPYGIDRLTRIVRGNPTIFDNMYNGVRTVRQKLSEMGKSRYTDRLTGIEVSAEELHAMENLFRSALLEARESGYSDGSVMHRLKANRDAVKYGLEIGYQVDLFKRGMKFDKDLNVRKVSEVSDIVREAFTIYDEGNREAAYNKLLEGGRLLAEHYMGDLPDSFINSFADTFTEHYRNGVINKIVSGRDSAGSIDYDTFGVSVPKYLLSLENEQKLDNPGFGDGHIEAEQAMRKAFTLLHNGGSEDDARLALLPAAEYLLGIEHDNSIASAADIQESVSGYIDNMILHYNNNQAAAETTPAEIRLSDNRLYSRDIETGFRQLGVAGVTEGEIKGFADITRRSIDRLGSGDYTDESMSGIKNDIDAAVFSLTAGRGRSSEDICTVTGEIWAAVRESSKLRISKQFNEIMEELTHTEAGTEEYSVAHARLDKLKEQQGNLLGFNDKLLKMRESNVSAKFYKTAMSDEFKAAVGDRRTEMTYRVISNAESYEEARRIVAHSNLDELTTYLASKPNFNATDTTVAELVAAQYSALGQNDKASDVVLIAQQHLTEAGQATQAWNMFYKMTATGQIVHLHKQHDRNVYKEFEKLGDAYKKAAKDKFEEHKSADARLIDEAQRELDSNSQGYHERRESVERMQKQLEDLAKKKADAEERAKKLEERKQQLYEERKAQIKFDKSMSPEAVADRDRRAVERRERLALEEKGYTDEEIIKLRKEAGGDDRPLDWLSKIPSKTAAPAEERAALSDTGRREESAANGSVSDEANSQPERLTESVKNDSGDSGAYDIGANDGDSLDPDWITEQEELLNKQYAEALTNASSIEQRQQVLRGTIAEYKAVMEGDIQNYIRNKSGLSPDEEVMSADRYLTELGIEHISHEDMQYIESTISQIDNMRSAEELIEIIKTNSEIRHTAKPGRFLDSQLNKAYRDMEHARREILSAVDEYGGDNAIEKNIRGFLQNKAKSLDGLNMLKDVAKQQVFGMMQDMHKASIGKKTAAGLYISQLLNGVTTIRNVLSNGMFHALDTLSNNVGFFIDLGVSRITGQRSIAYERLFTGGAAAKSRTRLSFLEQALNVDLLNGTSRIGDAMKVRSFKSGPGAVLERGLGYSMSVTDEFQKGLIEGQMLKAYRSLVDKGYYTAKQLDAMMREEMLYRTFQDDTLPARFLEGIKRDLNMFGFGETDKNGSHEFGLGNLLTNYTTVAGNIFTRSFEYSPLGALTAISDIIKLAREGAANARVTAATGFTPNAAERTFNAVAQRRLIMDIARPLSAAMLVSAGFGLRKLGVIVGSSQSEDYNDEQYEKSKGLGDFKINASLLDRMIHGESDGLAHNGDNLVDMGWLVGINTTLSMGAAIADRRAESDGSLLSIALGTNVDFIPEQMTDLSLYSSVYSLINNWKHTEGISEFVGAETADLALSFNPSLINQIANSYSDYSRNPYKNDSSAETALQKFLAKGWFQELRSKVPMSIDIFGQPKESSVGSRMSNILNNTLNPAKVSKYVSNKLTSELDRLTELSTDILPKSPYTEYKFSLDGQPYSFKLTGADYEQYSRFLGQTTYNNMLAFVDSEDYRYLNDQQRVETLEEITRYSAYTVRDAWAEMLNNGSNSFDDVQSALKADIEKYSRAAADYVRKQQAIDYLNTDGVNVEDVVYAYNKTDYTKGEIIGKTNYNNEKIEKIRKGTYYEYRYRDDGSEYKSFASQWSDEERQAQIASLKSQNARLENGTLKKYETITGAFKNLSDADKAAVMSAIDYQISSLALPEEATAKKPDMSEGKLTRIDLTGKRSETEMKLFLQLHFYNMGGRRERSKLPSALTYSGFSDTGSSDTGSSSGSSVKKSSSSGTSRRSYYSSWNSGYKNFKRNYSRNKYYYKRRYYKRRYYSRRSWRRKSYSGGYYTKGSRIGSYNVSSRFTPGGGSRFKRGGNSRFKGFKNSAYRFIPRFGQEVNNVYK